MNQTSLQEFFSGTAALAPLCTQNGWPDPASMRIELLEEDDRQALCAVRFDEVIMEGSGCEAGRVACWGRFRVRLDARGRVVRAELETGGRE
ncbi:MAG: hypothetical protein Q7U07_07765 [Gammaproteobacteria bacterium]|nr:hypothetical protein [Gammaproteobacteria bacterium]